MIDLRAMLPAPGQGALAIQCRRDDAETYQLLEALNDPDTAECVAAERALVTALEGDCHSPIAALATVKLNRLDLSVAVGSRDGMPPVVRTTAEAPRGASASVVTAVMDSPFAAEARKLLHKS